MESGTARLRASRALGNRLRRLSQPFLIPGGIPLGSRGMRFSLHSVHGGVRNIDEVHTRAAR